jgi:putative hydrolase of the HAD superfamily
MTNNTIINTFIFDAGGVLFEAKIRRGQRIKTILKSHGFNEESIDNAIRLGNEFCNEFQRQGKWISTWDEERIYWDTFYSQVISGLGIDNLTLKEELYHLTLYFNNCELFLEVRGVLDKLFGKYQLGVISNAFPSMDWIFDLLEIRRYFENITISAFVNTFKPNHDI